VWGANHNFYNSEWMQEDTTGFPSNVSGCFNHEPLFERGSAGSAAQRETERFAAVSFFTANVGTERDAAANAVFDPAFSLPVPYRVSRGYHPGGSPALSLRLEDFINPTGTSSHDLRNDTGGTISVNHGSWAALSNIVASPSTFFQTNFAPVGGGFDLTSYDFIDLRAGRLGGNEYSTEVVSFEVELVNDGDSRSRPVSISSYLELGRLPRGNATLPTARIPLSAFEGAQLDAIRAVRLTFPSPIPEGYGVNIANIRATRLTTATTL
jgi:hypothetical protein